QLREAFAPRAAAQLVDDHHADAAAARRRVHRERSNFGDVRAERRQLRAADDLPRPHGDDELVCADRELAERPRQQMSFVEVRLDQREQLLRIGGFAGPQPNASTRSLCHCAAPTAPSAASRRASPSSTSGSVITSGGSSLTTVSAVRLTTTPRSSAAGTTAAASRVSSSPHINPRPRTSFTSDGRDAAIARRRRSTCWPTRPMCASNPPPTSSSSTHSAARHASRFPPYVVP